MLAVVMAVICASSTRAQEPPAGAELFDQQVAPILVRNCVDCHNASQRSGGLDLTARDTALAGGDSGPVIVADQPDASYLVERVAEGSMPPANYGGPLKESDVAALREWIGHGAPWPTQRRLSPFELSTDRRAGYDWWSLQPIVEHAPPKLDDPWIRTPLDQFVLLKLRERGLAPSVDADRGAFIRRATFDLLGLPPTVEEIDAFLADLRPDAYERLIDRLLASPRYGERWGRHWLDVVRFGETNGYETNTPRPNAWHYRDYVIESLNADKPFDQFIREQLAGDQLAVDAATGFLVGGPHDTVGNQTLEGTRQQRADDLDDMITATSGAFLGLSIGCARCHDHKFDPISQRDYYGLQAMFAGVKHGERTIRGPDYEQRLHEEPEIRRQLAAIDRRLSLFEPLANTSSGENAQRRAPVHARWNTDRFAPVVAKFIRFTILKTNQFEPCIDELEIFTADSQPRNVALANGGATATASSEFENGRSPIHKLVHVNDGIYGNGHSWISAEPGAGWVQIELAEPATIDRVVWARDREERFDDRLAVEYRIEVATEPDIWQIVATSDDRAPFDPTAASPAPFNPDRLPNGQAEQARQLLAEREELLARLPEAGLLQIYSGAFDEHPALTHRLERGDVMQPREEVPPATPHAVGQRRELSDHAVDAQRRRTLADWITAADNPLTARVLVNRVWQHHFGRGLVNTPNDFGFHGGKPSHPELLDWLATRCIAEGWHLKSLHRLIMLSSTYRQASTMNDHCATVDADSRLLWRFPPRRLEAEAIRDAILAASGKLDLRMGGPGYDVFQPNKNYVHVYLPKTEFGPDEWRRMVYQFKPRMEQDATFGAFDCPDASASVGRRHVSTTALQALNLLNSPFVIQQAGYFAERLRREVGDEPVEQARRGFAIALGREPATAELHSAVSLIEGNGLAVFCRALFNANEFVYLD
jgi:mono/diheme cytochrome c family protein